MSDRIILKQQVPDELGQKRLDQVAALIFPEYSRSRLQSWIKDGHLLVDGVSVKGRTKLIGGEHLTVDLEVEPEGEWLPQDIPLDIVYQDDHIIVVNKPTGLVVHPGAGNPDGTMVNALLFQFPDQVNVPRAGIVHRLDKDTTGLMVVARTLKAHAHIVAQLQEREMGREYEAICQGVLTGGGTVDEPLSRHGNNRLKMAVHPSGKEAITHFVVLKRFQNHTHIRLKLETGRTHQIRVHMSHLNYPLVGDPVYGGRQRLPARISPDLQKQLRSFGRQALHAKALELIHPETLEQMEWEIPLPEDMQSLIKTLNSESHNYDFD